jgi:hypothetical protein
MARERVKVEAKDVDRTGLSERGKDTLAMLTALEDEDRLSDWEQGFVADISDWFLIKQRQLTPNQFEHLKKVYSKFN